MSPGVMSVVDQDLHAKAAEDLVRALESGIRESQFAGLDGINRKDADAFGPSLLDDRSNPK